MAGRHPFQGRVLRQKRLVKDDVLVLPPQLAESRLQSLADSPERTRHTTNLVKVGTFFDFFGLDSGEGRSLDKEFFNHFGDKPPLLRFNGLSYNGRQVQLAPGQPFQGRVRDALEPALIDFLNDALLDDVFGLVSHVHLADHLFQ